MVKGVVLVVSGVGVGVGGLGCEIACRRVRTRCAGVGELLVGEL